ncbi:hypothetical protein ACTID9_07985 [Brevibacillus fluminis]|uniref:hypothetical protein n=1 Tax=Brevibacillus fluminis TaxID=511487 RepID=UPI003F88F1DF
MNDTTLAFTDGNLTNQIAYNDDANGTYFSEVAPTLTGGVTYYVKVAPRNYNHKVIARLTAAVYTPPLPVLSLNSPVDVDAPAGTSKVFTFKPASSGTYSIFTGYYGGTSSGGTNDTQLYVYTDAALTNQIAYNDDTSGTTFSQVDPTLTGGVTYYVKIVGYNNGSVHARLTATVYNPISLQLGSGVITEAAANDGSFIATQKVTVINGTFASDMSSGVTVNRLPAGLGITVTRNSNTQITIAFTGKATNHANANDVTNASVTIAQAKITGANFAITSGNFTFDFLDPEPTLSLGSSVIQEAPANDGSITDTLSVFVTNGTFAADLSGGVIVNNLPAGLGITVTRNSNTQLTIAFTGKAANYGNANDVANATVTILQSKITGAIANMTTGTFLFDFRDSDPALTLGSLIIKEAAANDGSFAEKQVITLTNGTFAADLSGGVVVNNLPAGLGIVVTRDSGTQMTIAFTGKATSHSNANDVNNASVTVLKAKISGATKDVTSGLFTFDFADAAVPGTYEYVYDTRNRLQYVKVDGVIKFECKYDDNGNLIEIKK